MGKKLGTSWSARPPLGQIKCVCINMSIKAVAILHRQSCMKTVAIKVKPAIRRMNELKD
uniref:Uncharacterized protein n=1 Tax=Aquila chrysaetos chrysaetos TaxID=223781 RepID=A0A663EPU1_AQUCH